MNKKVYIISSPRSYSVCIARVLEETNLFELFHEPYVSVYEHVKYGKLCADWFVDSAFKESSDVTCALNEAVTQKHVLVKDMSFSIVNYLDDIINDENAYFILLLRNPIDVFISLYNKFKQANIAVDADLWRDVCGYYQMKKIYDKLNENKCKFMLSETDDLMVCINQIFQFLDIEFKESYTKWDPCTDEMMANKSKKWRENKINPLFLHWHTEALYSSGIIKKSNKNPHSLMEITDEKDRKLIQNIYDEILPTYKYLLSIN